MAGQDDRPFKKRVQLEIDLRTEDLKRRSTALLLTWLPPGTPSSAFVVIPKPQFPLASFRKVNSVISLFTKSFLTSQSRKSTFSDSKSLLPPVNNRQRLSAPTPMTTTAHASRQLEVSTGLTKGTGLTEAEDANNNVSDSFQRDDAGKMNYTLPQRSPPTPLIATFRICSRWKRR